MSARPIRLTDQLTDEEAAQLIARALADPQRYRILKMLAQAPESTQCSVLFEAIKLAPATLSHHMKELHEAGLVEVERTGRTVRYTVRQQVLEAFLNQLERDLLPFEPES